MPKKKKKKKEVSDFLWFPNYVPGMQLLNVEPVPTPPVVENTIEELPEVYMPLWKAWLLYSAYTAGLPLGHETMGAALGAKIARNVGIRATIGGGVGYLGAIVIVGTIATVLDPLDYYEGGLDVTPSEIKAAASSGVTSFANEVVNPSPTVRGRLNPLGIRTGWQ
jgi:hypothetical protein